jgi:hypothetical protein
VECDVISKLRASDGFLNLTDFCFDAQRVFFVGICGQVEDIKELSLFQGFARDDNPSSD